MEVPHYKLILDEQDTDLGLKILSAVEDPAIMIGWTKFDAKEIKLSILNEDKRIVFGPALIPDLPIQRSINGQQFTVSIDRENIFKTLLKLQKENPNLKSDTNHDQQIIEGVTIFEKFVTDEDRVPTVKGFDLPVGTLFFTGKIEDDATWEKVKSGELKGWSIDALFKFKPAETITDKETEKLIREILSQ
jgi:hypothetical protein